MRASEWVSCKSFPCADVNHACYQIPAMELKPEGITTILISEAAPPDPADYYYAPGSPLFLQTTTLAFNEAGVPLTTIQELLKLGVYLTTAVKCGKTDYGIASSTVAECSSILEQEISLFPNVIVILLMGDVAIKAVNGIARRAGVGRVIPAGPTYKLRGGEFYFKGLRVFPSYLQAGPSFFIEKSKRKMIAEDISAAMRLRASH